MTELPVKGVFRTTTGPFSFSNVGVSRSEGCSIVALAALLQVGTPFCSIYAKRVVHLALQNTVTATTAVLGLDSKLCRALTAGPGRQPALRVDRRPLAAAIRLGTSAATEPLRMGPTHQAIAPVS